MKGTSLLFLLMTIVVVAGYQQSKEKTGNRRSTAMSAVLTLLAVKRAMTHFVLTMFPTFLHMSIVQPSENEREYEQFCARKKRREERMIAAETSRESTGLQAVAEELDDLAREVQQLTAEGVGTQTEITLVSIECLEARYCKPLQIVLEKVLSEDFLKTDSSAVKFYTGLPSYSHLNAVFLFVSAPLKKHHRSVLSLFEQFLWS